MLYINESCTIISSTRNGVINTSLTLIDSYLYSGSGDIFLLGKTSGSIDGVEVFSNDTAFVSKADYRGNVYWTKTHQYGTSSKINRTSKDYTIVTGTTHIDLSTNKSSHLKSNTTCN